MLDECRTLTITDMIRTGYSCGAQVVVVNGDVVAKIYDPLYDAGFDCYDNKRDVVVLADGDYSREAAAYEELQRCPAALGCTPKYHGSWTIEVHTTAGDQTYIRQVRLILMEHITGTAMSSIQSLLLSRQTRSAIMVKTLEAESFIFNAGVLHRDVSPRNIMLICPSPTSSLDDPNLRVVVIDFNVSNVIRRSVSRRGDIDSAFIQQRWPGKILSPVTRFWDAMQEFEVRDWVSDEYGRANEWLWEWFGGRDEYVPLVRDLGDREACPRVAWCGEVR
jgi:serine/threonine protein kinase